jgi:hypothetical protein
MKLVWKIYSVIYTIIACIIVISVFSDNDSSLIDYIDSLLSIFTVLATILWSWNKSLGSQKIWIIYCFVFFAVDAIYNIFFEKFNGTIAELLIVLALIIPGYLATILYAINFNTIKTKKSNNSININNYSANSNSISPPTDSSVNTAWNMHTENTSDAQLTEIRYQQNISAVKNSMADSLSKEVQTTYEEKTEAEQLGKWPWERWYSHPVVGREYEKGIADLIFLTFFPIKSKSNNNGSQRAIIRILVTLIVLIVFGYIGNFLTST